MGGVVLLAVALLAVGVWTQLDLDNDGLDAATEWSTGSNPMVADTDEDGLSDGWEQQRGLNSLSRDTDGDGLEDDVELSQATNPEAADSDNDTLPDPEELDAGTDPRSSDTDEDGLPDDHEATIGTDPIVPDTDGDGLDDAAEAVHGADPLATDTDGDGLPDSDEAQRSFPDCDGDGIPAIAEADDDADHRRDADEDESQRCNDDSDGDGVLDGKEKNTACIELADCDGDGLEDGVEVEADLDPLNGDTYDAGLSDSVIYAFQQQGQEPSGDDDRDGIPDRWENTAKGTLDWGPYTPEPGKQDLFIEFVKVEGPTHTSQLGLSSSYQQVAEFFEANGFNFEWSVTTAQMPPEEIPPLIPSSHASYYRDVLSQSQYATNPYVTTVVLNPHHDQSTSAHIGAAPIRSMLATVDYGAHTTATFSYVTCGSQSCTTNYLDISPDVESLIYSDRQDLLQQRGWSGGGMLTSGEYYLETSSAIMYWYPFWFSTAPTIQNQYGSSTQLQFEYVSADQRFLASTIVHELGHTLGLCHTENPSCYEQLSPEDRANREQSTMHSGSGATLNFLSSEWRQVERYLTCPPSEPLKAVAEGETTQTIIEDKYGYLLEDILDVGSRDCGDFQSIPRTMEPDEPALPYHPDYAHTTTGDVQDEPQTYDSRGLDVEALSVQNSQASTISYGLAAFVAAAMVGVGGTVGHAVWRTTKDGAEGDS